MIVDILLPLPRIHSTYSKDLPKAPDMIYIDSLPSNHCSLALMSFTWHGQSVLAQAEAAPDRFVFFRSPMIALASISELEAASRQGEPAKKNH